MSEERPNLIHDILREEDPMHGFKPPAREGTKEYVHYTKELGHIICARIAGGESLNRICKDEDMPHRVNVYRWLLDDSKKDFKRLYDVAKEMQADALADEILDIADDGSNDWRTITKRNGDSEEVPDNEVVMRSKLRVDARKWLAGVMKPRKYGDKSQVEISGDPNKPVQTVTKIEIVAPALKKDGPKALDVDPAN